MRCLIARTLRRGTHCRTNGICREITLRMLESRSLVQKIIHWGAYQICRIVAFLPFWPEGMREED